MKQVYDIIMNDNNEIQVVTYEAKLVPINKKDRQYVFNQKDLMDLDYKNLTSIQDKIRYLVAKGFISITAFDNFINHPSFQSIFLRNKYRLLQQVYDEVIIDNVLYVITYFVYINVFTGQIYCRKSQKLRGWSQEYIEKLENEGYKQLFNSYLSQYVDKLDARRIIPMKLTRKR